MPVAHAEADQLPKGKTRQHRFEPGKAQLLDTVRSLIRVKVEHGAANLRCRSKARELPLHCNANAVGYQDQVQRCRMIEPKAGHFATNVRVHEVEGIDCHQPECCNISLVAVELTFAECKGFATIGRIVLLVAPVSVEEACVVPSNNATDGSACAEKERSFRY
jgi:hypothetical protein